MRNLLMLFAICASLFIPCVISAAYDQEAPNAPPVEQPLVREGEFAVKLVEALELGKTQSEAEAERLLASLGIAPANGWIADYPVTPDVLGELRNNIRVAAESGRLDLTRDEALQAFRDLASRYGLSLTTYNQDGIIPSERPQTAAAYPAQTTINNYYYRWGPPLVTWYRPPWDFYYLYAWVPYPFWYSGFWFPGYYCLRDFDRVITVRGCTKVITNHVRTDPHCRTVVTIDPARRRTPGKSYRVIARDVPSRPTANASVAPASRAPVYRERPAINTTHPTVVPPTRPHDAFNSAKTGSVIKADAPKVALPILNPTSDRDTGRSYPSSPASVDSFRGMTIERPAVRVERPAGSFSPNVSRGVSGGPRGSYPFSGRFGGVAGRGFSGPSSR